MGFRETPTSSSKKATLVALLGRKSDIHSETPIDEDSIDNAYRTYTYRNTYIYIYVYTHTCTYGIYSRVQNAS